MHPAWYVHQLIADVLAWNWMALEDSLSDLSCTGSDARKSCFDPMLESPPLFPDSDLSRLSNCSVLSQLGNNSFAPLQAGPGWSLVRDKDKIGWQFDATKATPSTIKFAVRFGPKPVLAITYVYCSPSFVHVFDHLLIALPLLFLIDF